MANWHGAPPTQNGWSPEALAEKSGVPAITTKQFENGDTNATFDFAKVAPDG
jgi:hypothetical protein